MAPSIQKEILSSSGNILVTANPGTGKTHLLAQRYLHLIKSKVDASQILCLTFTSRAKHEMEDRIIGALAEANVEIDLSKLNVYTFHSYALEYIDDGEIISSNLLRYIIYEYLKENEVFNYGDERLISVVVPRMENLIRYLKSYGITPDVIDKEKVRLLIKDYERSSDIIEEKELHAFLDYFIHIFALYEKEKQKKGIDYADLLINFLKLKNKPRFKHVLIDELQDVNCLEAQIAIESGEQFFAVGDKKQAIVGFQGGAVGNFDLFREKKPKEFNLIENRRSTQQILDFAAENFKGKTKDNDAAFELEGLKNFSGKVGAEVNVIESDREDVVGKICALLNGKIKSENIAILVRTNAQIIELAKELSARNIHFSSTYIASSIEAKENVIRFLKAIFSQSIEDVKAAFFTPFFPISLQKAFELSAKKNLSINEIYLECPKFKIMRESQKDIETISSLFSDHIFPVCIAYGEEYLLAAQALSDSSREALVMVKNKTLENFVNYLQASDMPGSEAKKDAKIVLTTVHKAKGLEFGAVIYWAKKTHDNSGFYDYVIERIIESKGRLEQSELEEEMLRIDFVAYTRAKEELYIIAENGRDYLNNYARLIDVEVENLSSDFEEKQRRAYSMFISKDYEGAKKLLETDKAWIKSFVKAHFDNLEHISFSKLNTNAYDYLISNILQLKDQTYATNLGSNLHDMIQNHLEGKQAKPEENERVFFENALQMIEKIKKDYPEFVEAEHEVYIPLSNIIATRDPMHFKGYIDAIFRNKNSYLIVDWKTSSSTNDASKYRRQLELYKRAYAAEAGIELKDIKVAIGFIGLRRPINDHKIYSSMDITQPKSSVFETLIAHFQKILEWKSNPDIFLEELSQTKTDNPIVRAVVEQYRLEK